MGIFWNKEEAARLRGAQQRRAMEREQVRLRDALNRSPVTRGVFTSAGAQAKKIGWETDAASGVSEGYLIVTVDGEQKKIEYFADA